MAALPSYQTIVKPNTHDLSTTTCQQFIWLDHQSPTTPYRQPNGEVSRSWHISGPPDGLGNPSFSETWVLVEKKFMVNPEGVTPWLGLTIGGHYINWHAVGGDVGWTPPWTVSPILVSLRSSGGVQQHLLELPHDHIGSDNGSGGGTAGAGLWTLPTLPYDVWVSIIMHITWGRFSDYAAAGVPRGRVQMWFNAADGSIVSPANGDPSFDTGVGRNTMIRDVTNGVNQQYVQLYEGQYNPTGFANVSNPFAGQTVACRTCANSGGCVNGLLDRHFYMQHTACRLGKTLAEALGDTSITLRTYRRSRWATAASPNYGDTVYTLLTGAAQRSTDTFILPPALDPNPLAPRITSFSPASGTAGVTSVTITGTNFTGATLVSFNGVAASFVVNSASQITATVPASATTGVIQVTTPNGIARGATDFTVGATSAPVLPDPAANHLRIGNSALGSYNTATITDSKRVLKRGVGAGRTVTIDRGYFLTAGPPTVGSEPLRVIVYDDDGIGGLPGTFLGMSDEVVLAQGAAAAWVPFTFSTPVTATGDQIYFGVIFGGPGSANYNYQTVTGQGWRNTDTYADGPSNPFGASPVVINVEIALVVDYQIVGDTVAPSFVPPANIVSSLLTIPYDETLDPASVPDLSAFAVTVNQLAWSLDSVSIDGTDVLLMLTNPVDTNDLVTVAYTRPGTGALQDVFGNQSASLAQTAVANLTEPQIASRRIDPAARVAVVRRIDPSSRRAGEGGGL